MTDADLKTAFEKQVAAMTAGDTRALSALLLDDFTLTHMTGYRQPKTEWLRQMDEGLFVYHHIDIRSLTIDGAREQLSARLLTNASIYGSRATWRLQLVQAYRDGATGPMAASSVASTW